MLADDNERAQGRPLVILVNALSAVIGGGITVATKLVGQIAHDFPEHRLLLLCTQEDVAEFSYPENVEVLRRPDLLPRLARWKWEQTGQVELLKERGVDVVLGLGGYLCFRTDVPQVAVWQNSNVFSPPGIKRPASETALVWAQRIAQFFSMRGAAQNVFLTDNSVDLASRWWKMDRIRHCVIRSGVDLEGHSPEASPPITERDHTVLSVGHTYTHKNYEAMIDAMAAYRARFDDTKLRLEIVGAPANPQYFAALEERIRGLGLEDQVAMLGPLPPDAVRAKMSSARLYLVTSLLETFGLTLLEAMGFGLPVLASNATCHPEVGGEAVLYCEPREPGDIAEKMHRLLTEDELANNFRERGFVHLGGFSWKKTARQYVRELARVVGETGEAL
jgi:glycosyltransferase involved in cell wall biosynthesis